MAFNMVANHAIWPKANDAIFGLAAKAKEAIDKYGKENVINSTLGALVDDNGELICLNTVYQELKSLPNSAIAAYAQVAGQPDFLEAVQKVCFGKYRPNAYIRAVATPGGTGSVRHGIYNYTNPGDSILVGDWHWAPYVTISEEYGRTVTNHELFNSKNEFNIESFKEKFEELLNKQKRLVAVINTPANNPTGYSLSDEEWDEVLNIAKENAKDPENKIIIMVDCAYIDYAGIGDERINYEKFLNQFNAKEILIQEIVPEVINLSYDDYETAISNMEIFKYLGISIENFGNNAILINNIPTIFKDSNLKDVFFAILDNLKDITKLNLDFVMEKIIKEACVKSVKSGDRLHMSEVRALLNDLRMTDNPYTCPHGRPVIIKMTRYEIEKMFERIKS
jgi:hypothetical protein